MLAIILTGVLGFLVVFLVAGYQWQSQLGRLDPEVERYAAAARAGRDAARYGTVYHCHHCKFPVPAGADVCGHCGRQINWLLMGVRGYEDWYEAGGELFYKGRSFRIKNQR